MTLEGTIRHGMSLSTECVSDVMVIAFGPIGSYVDLSGYYTKSEVDTALSGKQATLVSGTNIKTINGNSVLGSGNINIQGGGGVQSDWNVSDTSSMAYIKNKPTIPTVPTNVSAFTNDAGYLTTETDPTVPNHVKGITQQNITNWNNKADSSDLANYYTKSEIDTTIGDIETLLANI